MRVQIGDEPREILSVKDAIEDLQKLDPEMLCYKRSFNWGMFQGKMVIEIGNVNVHDVPIYADESKEGAFKL